MFNLTLLYIAVKHEDEFHYELDTLWRECPSREMVHWHNLFTREALSVLNSKAVPSTPDSESPSAKALHKKKRSAIEALLSDSEDLHEQVGKKRKIISEYEDEDFSASSGSGVSVSFHLSYETDRIDMTTPQSDSEPEVIVIKNRRRLVSPPRAPYSRHANLSKGYSKRLHKGPIAVKKNTDRNKRVTPARVAKSNTSYLLYFDDSESDGIRCLTPDSSDKESDIFLGDTAEAVLDDDDPSYVEDEYYIVEKILDRRLRAGVLPAIEHQATDFEYLVSWEGYSKEENTWEPYENLSRCSEKLGEYLDRIKKRALNNRVRNPKTRNTNNRLLKSNPFVKM